MGAESGAGLTETPGPASGPASDADADVFYCARHPSVETVLRCGRCDTPICPRCLVQTPVGARCPTCANVSRLPTFNITPVYFARAMTAAIVSGIGVGAVWAIVTGGIGFGGFFMIFIGLAIGWAISESISLAANRRRGVGLQVCAVLGAALAFLVHEAVAPGSAVVAVNVITAGIGGFFAASRLKF